MSSIFTCDLELEQIVYLKTDPDQCPRMITGIQFTAGGSIQYCLERGTEFTWHFQCDISTEKITIGVTA